MQAFLRDGEGEPKPLGFGGESGAIASSAKAPFRTAMLLVYVSSLKAFSDLILHRSNKALNFLQKLLQNLPFFDQKRFSYFLTLSCCH